MQYHLTLRCRTLLDRELITIATRAVSQFRTLVAHAYPGREVETTVSFKLAPLGQERAILSDVTAYTSSGLILSEWASYVEEPIQQLIDERCSDLLLRRAQRRYRASKAATARWAKREVGDEQ